MRTLEQIQADFECDDDMAELLLSIQETGYYHGIEGWYPDGDYSSDAGWCYGVSARIMRAEATLDIYDNSVFELYTDAHNEGLCAREVE